MGCGHLGVRAGWRPVRPIIGGFISERSDNYAVSVTRSSWGKTRSFSDDENFFITVFNWCTFFSGDLTSLVAGRRHQLCKKQKKKNNVCSRLLRRSADPHKLHCQSERKHRPGCLIKQNSVICWQSGEFPLFELSCW